MARRTKKPLTAEQQANMDWLTEWYANSVSGSVLADYAAGNVKVIVAGECEGCWNCKRADRAGGHKESK